MNLTTHAILTLVIVGACTAVYAWTYFAISYGRKLERKSGTEYWRGVDDGLDVAKRFEQLNVDVAEIKLIRSYSIWARKSNDSSCISKKV